MHRFLKRASRTRKISEKWEDDIYSIIYPVVPPIDNSTKGGLTQFWQLFTVIPGLPALEDFKCFKICFEDFRVT